MINNTRNYFAGQAMSAVMNETQEMKIASFGDWIKSLLVLYLHFTFLTVKYKKVDNVYEDAAKRAFEYADAMMAEKERASMVNKDDANTNDKN